MKIRENLSTLLIAIYLIVSGVVSIIGLHIPILSNLLPLVALVAGLLLLIGTGKLPKTLGIVLLAVWLILKGLLPFVYISIPHFAFLTDGLAIVAGIFILFRR
ncbi:hypothetical protein HQ585_21385 [candidate division KSB1 bacterium]|nr:hypothetical protein [candidate division KSB1 bacterium]